MLLIYLYFSHKKPEIKLLHVLVLIFSEGCYQYISFIFIYIFVIRVQLLLTRIYKNWGSWCRIYLTMRTSSSTWSVTHWRSTGTPATLLTGVSTCISKLTGHLLYTRLSKNCQKGTCIFIWNGFIQSNIEGDVKKRIYIFNLNQYLKKNSI